MTMSVALTWLVLAERPGGVWNETLAGGEENYRK